VSNARRHRFEPARLVLGLGLLLTAALHLARLGQGGPPLLLPVLLVPAVLLLSAAVGVTTHLVRRRRRPVDASRD
jgi:hypothetical protein